MPYNFLLYSNRKFIFRCACFCCLKKLQTKLKGNDLHVNKTFLFMSKSSP